ncbi:thiol S-methyltransferase TMT1A-like [Macrobrachium nipponense]|uniref:thiol S-methyltransferase TMT1A-like n=1 Tax=Macrobrachium nipponense TaxID=159736 RepID=UPI0030C84B65
MERTIWEDRAEGEGVHEEEVEEDHHLFLDDAQEDNDEVGLGDIVLEHEHQREAFDEAEVVDETGESNDVPGQDGGGGSGSFFNERLFNERWLNETAMPVIEWVRENRVLVIAVLLVLLILRWKLKDFRRRWFAAFLNRHYKKVDAKIEEMKKDVFATLGFVVSHDPELRKTGGLKILEIGVGTGTNFAHYPDGTLLTVVDPNPHFKKYYEANRKKFPNIQAEDIIVSTGEDMNMVPDNSVDVVVVTQVFCSVGDTEKILRQILRVLVPGGKFYFYEHIHEFDVANHAFRRRLQSLLTFMGVWPFLFDNCHLNRDILKAVEATGFSKVEAQRFYAPINHLLLQIMRPSLKGVAEK